MTNEQDQRERKMIALLQVVRPHDVVDRQTTIKGATIASLCKYNAGGYNRVISWLEKQS